MDIIHAKDLKIGTRVVVYMGQVVAELTGTPPVCTTATVLDQDGLENLTEEDRIWLGVDFSTNDEQLPQMYRVSEIIGFLLPLATTTHHPDGSVTGTVEL